MYDVAVEVLPSETLAAQEDISINFHIAYVNPSFTLHMLTVRTFFTCVSMLILCAYCTKLCCRISPVLQRQLTYEQKGTLALISLLFFFNDPWYPVHIYSPSFMSFAGTELTSALFMAGLMVFWLRELAGFQATNE